MSYVTQNDLLYQLSGLSAALRNEMQMIAADLENEITSLSNRINSNQNAMRSWQTAHGPVAHDQIWKSINDLWKAHTEQGQHIEGINQRLSGQVVDLGQSLGGGFSLPSFGTGIGTGALLAGGALLAFLLLRR